MTLDELVRIGVDLALAILVIETVVLCLWRWRTGRGLPVATVVLISGSGLALLAALKAALIGAPLHWVGLALAAGGAAHAADLARRLTLHDRTGH